MCVAACLYARLPECVSYNIVCKLQILEVSVACFHLFQYVVKHIEQVER